MGGGTESVETKALSGFYLTQTKGSVSDDAAAEKRGGFCVREYIRDGVGKLFGDDHIFCVSAVYMVACEAGGGTEIFIASFAISALATGRIKPGYPGSISFFKAGSILSTFLYGSDNLMAGDDG
jgi:hypothetical protein